MSNPIGIYLHVPFCESKCAYCDFYSYKADAAVYDSYTETLTEHLKIAGDRLNRPADTLYFGGGTPSVIGGERIAKLVSAAGSAFLLKNVEITVEANPADRLERDLGLMADSGVNRLSLGVQSCIEGELKALSRRHCNADVVRTVTDAKRVGINNISLDLMLGIPHQTMKTLRQSLDFLLEREPIHISCYMLKIEPDTPFGRADAKTLDLPDEDTVADMYMFTSEYLQKNGFEHYEISNFARPGYRARHNTKYWLCEEYLGLGPAAYSYCNGKRFHFERSLKQYITSPAVIFDDAGGDFEEYCMLRLRLSDGIDLDELARRYGERPVSSFKKKAEKYENSGLLNFSENTVSLTVKGFLVSNAVISELLF